MYDDQGQHRYVRTASNYLRHPIHPHNHDLQSQDPHEDMIQLDPGDRELQRMHQQQIMIQLRLEINTLSNQIRQLELLHQQLIQQRPILQPEEYEQMMDQFTRTSMSLLSNVGHHQSSGSRIDPQEHIEQQQQQQQQYQQHRLQEQSSSEMDFQDPPHPYHQRRRPEAPLIEMPMLVKLQQRLRSMAQEQDRQYHHSHGESPPHACCDDARHGMEEVAYDPITKEQAKLERELRELEQRMKSMQLFAR